eukprot:m.79452 g.79452  ORF g.79452 m.79452 type:complete len:571 (+) comp9291_c0_seq1:248-1960(+)
MRRSTRNKLRLIAGIAGLAALSLYVVQPHLFVTPTDPPDGLPPWEDRRAVQSNRPVRGIAGDGLPPGARVRLDLPVDSPQHDMANGVHKVHPSKPAYHEQVPAPKDYRDPVCPNFVSKIRSEVATGGLPNTTVIFCFCNEPKSSLYHSIHSVIDRTPRHILHEIVLVDDGSDAPHLAKPLEDYVATLPVPVHIVRQGSRTGLMKARVAGARKATGVTLTFLDSHIDCSVDWAEPLMYRIWQDRTHVVMPIIDGLSRDFKYSPGGVELVGFNTRLVDHGIALQKIHQFEGRTAVDPEPSPAMAGGLFSIHREYFFEVGAFDEKMEHWGGENIEIGFRVWQCGGSIELVRCSRIAHVFGGMGVGCGWPGKPPGTKNKWRAIRAWMDDYADLMKDFLPEPADLGDMTYYNEIKSRLQCKSFQWFLDNVYPECWINIIRHPVRAGLLRNEANKECLSVKAHKTVPCVNEAEARSRNLWFFQSANDELLLSDVDSCLEASTWGSAELSTYGCHGRRGNQEWIYDQETQHFKHGDTPNNIRCLAIQDDKTEAHPLVTKCDPNDAKQKWAFVSGGTS